MSDLAELFAWADLIVTAGGVTCLEAACVGVPTLVLCIVDNQRRAAEGIVRRGLARDLGDHASLTRERFSQALTELRSQPQARSEMVAAQHAAVDGEGAERAAAALLAAFG